jgi:C-lobe and N-lobe beta barrels of Tf-binding protein B
VADISRIVVIAPFLCGLLLLTACASGGGGPGPGGLTAGPANVPQSASGSSGTPATSGGSSSSGTAIDARSANGPVTVSNDSAGIFATHTSSGSVTVVNTGTVSGVVVTATNAGSLTVNNSGAIALAAAPAVTFAPPAPATLGSNTTPVPNSGSVQTGSAFPLKQSVVAVSSNSIGPDVAANNGGATISVINWNGSGSSQFRLTIPGLGIEGTFSSESLFKGASTISTITIDLVAANLNYAAFGYWVVDTLSPALTAHTGMFATGFQTPATAMPTTGSATYSGTGNVTGMVATIGTGGPSAARLIGDATLTANFLAGTVTGGFTNMTATDVTTNASAPWNNVSVNASIVAGTSHFSGATAAASAPAGTFSVTGSATGHINGGFYGPQAQELGAVWSLSDSSKSAAAIGVVGASAPVSSGGGASSGAGIQAVGIWLPLDAIAVGTSP